MLRNQFHLKSFYFELYIFVLYVCCDCFRYLSLLATCPLGFSDNIRCSVEEAICDETKGPHADCFVPATNIVLAFLRKNYLIPFLSSQHYVHMLSDMIRSSSSIMDHSPTSSVNEYCMDSSKKQFLTKLDPDSIWNRRKRRLLFTIYNLLCSSHCPYFLRYFIVPLLITPDIKTENT